MPIRPSAVLPILVALIALLPAGLSGRQADPADVGSIGAIITAAYDVISGEAGEARDWDRWQTLFAEDATLSAVVQRPGEAPRRVVMTPESYATDTGPVLERNGFFEREIGRTTEEFGLIAHAFSTYESRRSEGDADPFARGINSFQLMSDGTRWWIVSIFWQGESAQHPIPDRYIGAR